LDKKYGSLQFFVSSDDVAGNYSSDLFSVEDVHKIAIFDLRILNLDRNDGNILVKKKRGQDGEKHYRLIPIDHALSLPSDLEINSWDICWMDWD